MRVRIEKGCAAGRMSAPPSKSMAHRLLIGAALAAEESRVRGVAGNEDILATIDCLTAFGAQVHLDGDVATVRGFDPAHAAPQMPLHCRESGSTLRFLIPLALLSGAAVTFTGSETLMSRPLGVYAALCADRHCFFSQTAQTVTVCGRLSAGTWTVPGDISSQFITGLLFALPLLPEDSVLHITPPVESRSYIDMTLAALAAFGVNAAWSDAYTLTIPGGQRYTAADVEVEGDYSGAAFFAALEALGGTVTIDRLRPDSLQGDKAYEVYLPALCRERATISLADCPDLGPVLFAVAAARHGGVFTDTRRLRLKESDRAAAMAAELQKFGVAVTVSEDTVEIYPGIHPPTAPLYGHNDHRIVMALAVLCTLTGGEIEGAAAVRKSYPDFFTQLSALGLEVTTFDA